MFFRTFSAAAILLATLSSATSSHHRHGLSHSSRAHVHRSPDPTVHVTVGQVVVVNRCPYDVWIWSAGVPTTNGGSRIHLPAQSRHWEPFRTCDGSGDCGGVSIKVSKTDELVGGSQTQFEYTIATYPGTSQQLLYYDISLVDCVNGDNADNCPGHDLGLEIQSNLGDFQNLTCGAGSQCEGNAYYVPNPSPQPVRSHELASMDLYFRLCSSMPFFSKRSVAGRVEIEDMIEVDTLAVRGEGKVLAVSA